MRSSLEHYCGFTRSTDDLLTFEIRGPVRAMILVAIWLGVVGGVGFGMRHGTTRDLADLPWISPSAHPLSEGSATDVSARPMAVVLSTGGDGRLRYLPFESITPTQERLERTALR